MMSEKQLRSRQKKIKHLQLQKEEQQKTELRKRSNKIFNNYLKVIDPELYMHLQQLQVQPELIFLKQLRCLLCREFTINNVLSMWDYVLAGIEEDGRFYLQTKGQSGESGKSAGVYGEEDYFFGHLDALINLDYVCVAMIQYQRQALLGSDYIDCLKVMMNYPKLECAADIIKISERVRKLLCE